jgi:4-amino-4-deoxy-L-arabinose transferase-like glycosyltransferase
MPTVRRLFLPILLTIIIVLFFLFYYQSMLPVGELHWYDEYFTLDRSNAFLVKGDWLSVYSNYEPNFKKPPLQYWLTALALTKCDDLEFALRIWPFLFGLGLLAAAGFLAYAVNPSKPYTIPASSLILAGSPMLWEYALSAMLDTGAALFLTLAIAGAILAIRRPKWWFFVAIVIWLGELQKSPVGIFALLAILVIIHATAKLHDIKLREILNDRNFQYAVALGSVLIFSWHLLQILRHGPKALAIAIGENSRFIPASDFLDRELHFWGWISQDAVWLWIPAILSLIFLPRFCQKPESLIVLLLFICFLVLVTLARGSVHPWYLLLVLPLLAVSLANLIAKIFPSGVFFIALVITLIAGKPLNTQLLSNESSQRKYLPLLKNFAKSLKDEEVPIYCKYGGDAKKQIFPGALSYYASNGRGFINLRAPGDLTKIGHGKSNYRGLCHIKSFEELKPKLEGYKVFEISEGFVHWTSP